MEAEIKKRLILELQKAKEREYQQWLKLSMEDKDIYPEFNTLTWNTNLKQVKQKIHDQILNDVIKDIELRDMIIQGIEQDDDKIIKIYHHYRYLVNQIREMDKNGFKLLIDYIKNRLVLYELNYLVHHQILMHSCKSYAEIKSLYQESFPDDIILKNYRTITEQSCTNSQIIDCIFNILYTDNIEEIEFIIKFFKDIVAMKKSI